MEKFLKPHYVKLVGIGVGVVAAIMAIVVATESTNASHPTNPQAPIALALVSLAFIHAGEQPLIPK